MQSLTMSRRTLLTTSAALSGYLCLPFLCLLVITFLPALSTALPHALGY